MDSIYLIAKEAHSYELSTLIREFFPLIRVDLERSEKQWGIELSEDEKTAVLRDENGSSLSSYTLTDPFDHYLGDAGKNYAKVAVYKALEKVKGTLTPWGILTGVRPTKVAYQYLTEGCSPEETIRILQEAYLLREDKARLTTFVAKKEAAILEDHEGSDISLYGGILFCPTRCSYCSFISNDYRAYQKYADDYVDALAYEITSCKELLSGRHIRSLYLGGGTPTTLNVSQLRKVLEAFQEAVPFSSLDEITVEAGRPDTITKKKLLLLKEMGVGRISINPQTMNQETLDRIGRKHSVESVKEAMAMAREVGFSSVNMDLIVGLPGEELPEVRNTLTEIEKLHPDNLTVHTLAVKRSSRMNELNEGKDLLGESLCEYRKIDAILTLCSESASRMGMQPYYMYRQKNMIGNFENVGYSIPGKEGRYNIEIMEERQSILAFGAGGVSKIYDPKINRLERVPNVKGVKEYIERIDEMIQRKKGGMIK